MKSPLPSSDKINLMLNKQRLFHPHMAVFLLFSFIMVGVYGCKPGILKTPPPATSTRKPSATQSLSLPVKLKNTATITQQSSPTPTSTEDIPKTIPTKTAIPNSTSPVSEHTDEVSARPTLTASMTASITWTATITKIPTRTPYPTRTRYPSRTPTITSTPNPPLAFFRINNLGMYSKVISPVRPEAIISPGEDGLIHIEIIDPDRKRIANEVFNYRSNIGRHFLIAPEIDFNVAGVAQLARLQVSSFDRFQRPMWLTSVELILLALGENQITAPSDLTEPYIIRQPAPDDEISHGMLEISGLARILNDTPLIIECVDPTGAILCSSQVELHASMDGVSHIPFTALLPYQVNEATNVRLTFRQESATRIPGTIALSSFEITLLP